MPNLPIDSLPFSSTRTVSWIHIGDTHLTRAGEQNEIDLGRIVDEINAIYAKGGVDFVFVPGDIADDGSVVAYEAFRAHLDRLKLPWCGIVGDHDVHEKSFTNFKKYVSQELYSAFSIGPYRFLRLNAFSIPRPDAFALDDAQLQWIEQELQQVEAARQQAILLLHCYPSDLKQGGSRLTDMLRRYPVLLVDMGHTHYNELSNEGKVLYSATRSTGQIEEGPVGYSVTTVDGAAVSWHFVPIGTPSIVTITSPEDERLLTERTVSQGRSNRLAIHAKVWSANPVESVSAHVGESQSTLTSDDGLFWTGEINTSSLPDGTYELRVSATDSSGSRMDSAIRVVIGEWMRPEFAQVDQDNAIGAWTERGLLGTQLGPNKNGKKW